MDAILTTYTDADFLDLLSSFVVLVPAGLILGVAVFLLGWFVAWVFAVLRFAK